MARRPRNEPIEPDDIEGIDDGEDEIDVGEDDAGSGLDAAIAAAAEDNPPPGDDDIFDEDEAEPDAPGHSYGADDVAEAMGVSERYLASPKAKPKMVEVLKILIRDHARLSAEVLELHGSVYDLMQTMPPTQESERRIKRRGKAIDDLRLAFGFIKE